MAAGRAHTCARSSDGTMRCWGEDTGWQPGMPWPHARPAPVRVTGLPSMRDVVAGDSHACGGAVDGRAFCWGNTISARARRWEPDVTVDARGGRGPGGRRAGGRRPILDLRTSPERRGRMLGR
nr:hypothetical protein [Deltaproteobacteria bacterium]